jgi:hypothetical protein
VTGGRALSDTTWDDTASSEITIRSRNPSIHSDCRLRLFEWSYDTMPSLVRPQVEQFPMRLSYAPLRVITTQSREKITLPGSKYPTDIEPDYVPILDSGTSSAARRGHLTGILAHAIIEKASIWASRTIVQGWNGQMYFSLPSRDDIKDVHLDVVYQKWNTEMSRLLCARQGMREYGHKHRSSRRLTCKMKKTADVYEASKWRPLAVSYMPSYLDWDRIEPKTSLELCSRHLKNLFYVRFPGCEVPHYYFWRREGEWEDPTIPDPAWSPIVCDQLNTVKTTSDVQSPVCRQHRTRKRTALVSCCDSSLIGLDPDKILSTIEHDLHMHGLSATFAKNRALARSIGKDQLWNAFTVNLPVLFPSGQLPSGPPVQPASGTSAAENIAALLSGEVFWPFNGDESWSRDDDAVWEVVTQAETLGHTLLPGLHSALGNDDDVSVQALYRRDSTDSNVQQPDRNIYAWLEHISSAYSPRVAPLSPTTSPEFSTLIPTLSSNHSSIDTETTCPFCNLPWHSLSSTKQVEHMLAHSHMNSKRTTTAISRIDATGLGAKRRPSMLSLCTLRSYSGQSRARKKLKLDSSAIQRWVGRGPPDSPFTRQKRALERERSELCNVVGGVERLCFTSPTSSCFGDDERIRTKKRTKKQHEGLKSLVPRYRPKLSCSID